MAQPFNNHRLAEERSLAYHQAVAERLRKNPERLDAVRRRLEAQRRYPRSPSERHWAQAWLEIVNQPLHQLLAFMVERSERAHQLRQSNPFAGLLTPAERWAIHREVKNQWLQRHERDPGTA